MLEVGFAEVVEGLPRHGGVFDLLLGWEEAQDGFHEGAFSGGGGGLDDDGKGLFEVAGSGGQVSSKEVGVFADDSGLVVGLGELF